MLLFSHKHVMAIALIVHDASHSVNQDNGQEVNTRWNIKRRKNPNEWRFREKTRFFVIDSARWSKNEVTKTELKPAYREWKHSPGTR